ncbi:MAG TPA: ribonuclease HII, partial [Thermoanaerobaculia bacterium]|nr:ribonuclease HII [Thermoanaerobaculia bacterium]
MAFDPGRMSLAELREWVAAQGGSVSPQALKKLGRDSRRGVRQLHEGLRRRADEERQRRLHLDALLNFERVLWRTGVRWIAGVDEVGVGPLAGPVVAAAVVFPPGTEIDGVDDSKRLDPPTRERLAVEIRARAEGIGIGSAEVDEIDTVNIYHAALLAMRRAVEALPMVPQHVLVDAREVPGLPMPQNPFNKGDGINFSIAAASIVAKTYRDRLMTELDAQYPAYGFARHKGYCTAEHQQAIRRHGPCPVHRKSYAFLHELCGELSAAFYELQQRIAAALDGAALGEMARELRARAEELPEVEHKK